MKRQFMVLEFVIKSPTNDAEELSPRNRCSPRVSLRSKRFRGAKSEGNGWRWPCFDTDLSAFVV